jgi:hypothetical protein
LRFKVVAFEPKTQYGKPKEALGGEEMFGLSTGEPSWCRWRS